MDPCGSASKPADAGAKILETPRLSAVYDPVRKQLSVDVEYPRILTDPEQGPLVCPFRESSNARLESWKPAALYQALNVISTTSHQRYNLLRSTRVVHIGISLIPSPRSFHSQRDRWSDRSRVDFRRGKDHYPRIWNIRASGTPDIETRT